MGVTPTIPATSVSAVFYTMSAVLKAAVITPAIAKYRVVINVDSVVLIVMNFYVMDHTAPTVAVAVSPVALNIHADAVIPIPVVAPAKFVLIVLCAMKTVVLRVHAYAALKIFVTVISASIATGVWMTIARVVKFVKIVPPALVVMSVAETVSQDVLMVIAMN